MATHRCPGCREVDVPDVILACPPCWDKLSPKVQRMISRTARLPVIAYERRAALLAAVNEWHPRS